MNIEIYRYFFCNRVSYSVFLNTGLFVYGSVFYDVYCLKGIK